MTKPILFLTVIYALSACATNGKTEDNSDLLTRKICINGATATIPLTAEIATTPRQRTIGLMHRKSLPIDHGMLFVFPNVQPAGNAFWMYQTLIPLDIAYLNNRGKIVAIRTMQPCTESKPQNCPRYAAEADFSFALEVNGNFYNTHQIAIGDTVILDDKQCLSSLFPDL